ncbi:MAG: hypothetical protein ACI9N9_000612 [Enterobacterales bacterium]|jgi:hypothetical protein
MMIMPLFTHVTDENNLLNAITTKMMLPLKFVLIILAISTASMVQASDSGPAKKHAAGIFFGILDNSETNNVIGLEYEYKFDPKWGVGVVYEKADDYHHGDGITSTIGSLYYHPMGAWRVGLGYGTEKVGGAHPHSANLTRFGVSYDFHVGKLGIAPSLNFDKVDGETAKVYGVAFLIAF